MPRLTLLEVMKTHAVFLSPLLVLNHVILLPCFSVLTAYMHACYFSSICILGSYLQESCPWTSHALPYFCALPEWSYNLSGLD